MYGSCRPRNKVHLYPDIVPSHAGKPTENIPEHLLWLHKNFVPSHQRYFKYICNIFKCSGTKQKNPWRGKLPVSWVIQSCTSTYKVPQQYKRIGVMNRNAQLELFPYFMLIIRLEPKLALIDIKS